MTTKNSPKQVLKAQASKIAGILKNDKMARQKEFVKFGIVMDDKTLTIEIPWAIIDKSTKEGLAEFILNQMQENKNNTIN